MAKLYDIVKYALTEDLTNGTNITSFQEMRVLAEEITCQYVNTLNFSDRCDFVQNNETCDYDGLIYNYTELTYCQLANAKAVAIIILFLVMVILFISIGSVADDFLCPSLLTVSKTFRLPDHIAGVTFLALGNGAPDIFSAIGGIRDSKPHLIFSSLFGAGIFVTTVVTGSVLVTGDFALMRRPVMRDIIFYICAAFIVWVSMYNGLLTVVWSASYLGFYACFIITVVIGRFIYVKLLAKEPENGATLVGEDNNGYVGSTNGIDQYESRSGQNSRRQSGVSVGKRSQVSEDDVILARFHKSGTLSTPRRRSRANSGASQRHYAHHHFDNSIQHVGKIYEDALKRGTVEDIRYTDTIQKERAESLRLSMANEQLKKEGYKNEIKFENNNNNYNPNAKRPTFKQQQSVMSILSIQSMAELYSEGKDFLIHVSPIDILEWSEYSIYRKVIEVLKAVPYFFMTICIPVVDLESPNENWCRLLICLNVICGPQAILFLTQAQYNIGGVFPLWALFLIVSPIVAIIIFITSSYEKPPIYHRVFGFIGFAISVIFVNSIAEELIALLTTFGIIFNLSDAILGLTVLAWGNSLGDLIANISMARHGYPGMAISACYGGQMMNLLLGFGLPYTILFLGGDTTEARVQYTVMMTLLFFTLMCSLTISLFTFVLRRFRSSKIQGIVLLIIYIVYLVLAILIEFKVLFSNFSSEN